MQVPTTDSHGNVNRFGVGTNIQTLLTFRCRDVVSHAVAGSSELVVNMHVFYTVAAYPRSVSWVIFFRPVIFVAGVLVCREKYAVIEFYVSVRYRRVSLSHGRWRCPPSE